MDVEVRDQARKLAKENYHTHIKDKDNFELAIHIFKKNLHEMQKIPCMKEYNDELKEKFLNFFIPTPDQMTKADSKFRRISKDFGKT